MTFFSNRFTFPKHLSFVLIGRATRQRRRQRRPKMLSFEVLEDRRLPSGLPDLVGYDARPLGYPSAYFHLGTPAVSWGDQVPLYFEVANVGATPPTPETYNVNVYISATSTITTSNVQIGRFTGLKVPNASTISNFTATLTLPASNPISPLGPGPYFIGMIIDPDNSVAESNKSNNSNQGDGIDRTTVAIQPPVAVVTDSVAPSNDLQVNFGSVVAGGFGNAQVMQTVTLSNSAARSLLKVVQNGAHLANGTDFHIVSILSNKLSQPVNVAGGSSLIATNSTETWTIELSFNPTVPGPLHDNLVIQTDDPANPTITIALSGTGLPEPNLVVANPANQTVDFGAAAVNGSGTATLTLVNNGSGPLTIPQNGITLPAGPFRITSITSNTQGKINLSTGAATIAAGSAESWTVGLKFLPAATGLFQQPLTILSNAPQDGTVVVSLLGTGQMPPHLAAPPGPVNFGSVPADGPDKQLASQTITLSNTGQMPLVIAQNGITLATGTQFQITGVTSSTQGTINLAAGPATMAGNGAELFTISVKFDPSLAGSFTDLLQIATNDPASPVTTVGLNGTGLNQPILVVNPSNLSFPPTLNDGAGGRSSTLTLQMTNIGTQPLVVPRNGLGLANGANFQVVSIVSSTQGAVNLATGSATLAATSSETWTVTVRCDAVTTGMLSDVLHIATSNDPVHPAFDVALNGQGVVPVVTAVAPTQAIHVSVGQVYRLTWNGTYAPGTATLSLSYDTDRNPATGLVPITTGLPQTRTYFDWQVPTNLAGSTCTVYVTMQDGAVSVGSYAAGSLTVDPVGSDRLLSAPVTDTANYTLSYSYKGSTYTVPFLLSPGDNALYPTAGGVSHEYHVFLAATLVDAATSTHDELGNVTSTTDANGQTAIYQYDQMSRLTHVGYADGTTVDYTYDAASNPLSMHDASGWQFYSYDILDRLSSVTYASTNNPNDPAALVLRYEHDADNNLTALTYPSGKRVEYGYDNALKLTKVTEKNAGQKDLVTTYAYDGKTGQLTTITRPNDTQTVTSYDSNGRLIDILHRRTSTKKLILEYHYTLDAAGRNTQVVVTSPAGVRAEAYVYDDLNRLVQVTYSNEDGVIDSKDKVVKYVYDKNGNRLSMATYAGGVAAGVTQLLTYAYGFENRLLTVTDQNGVVQEQNFYNWRGSQVMKVTPAKTTQFGYNSRNLLVAVDDGTNHLEYSYDGAGRRVGQSVNGVVTRFVIDPSNAVYQTIEERNASGAVNAGYVYGLERVSATLPGQSAPVYYLADDLGSVGSITGSTGSDLGDYVYDVFGNELSAPAGLANPFTFTGERLDPTTGLLDLRARSYAPTGRFTEKDPLGFVDGPSRYSYVASDPVNRTDPYGLSGIFGSVWNGIKNTGQAILGGLTKGGQMIINAQDAIASDAVKILTEGGQMIINAQDAMTRGAVKILTVGGQKIINAQDAIWNAVAPPLRMVLDPNNARMKLGLGVSIPFVLSEQTAAEFNGYGQLIRAPINEIGQDFPVLGVLSGSYNTDLTTGETSYGASAEATKNLSVGVSGSSLDNLTADISFGVLRASLNLPALIQASPAGQSFGLGFAVYDIIQSHNNPGGVLIDQAATLVNANVKDITGATFDPVSHQIVFLGNSAPATLHDVNLDLFTTAIQSVYGSAVPPYVTLDPPARLVQQSFNIGNGDGVIPSGKSANVDIHYTPYTPTEADDMTLTFNVNGNPVSVRLNGWVMNGQSGLTVSGGGRYGMGLTVASGTGAVTGLPAGVTVSMPPLGVDLLKPQFQGKSITLTAGGTVNLGSLGGSGYTLVVNAQGQDSNWTFTITNSSGTTMTVTNLQLIPDLQHRKFGGRVDNTKLGWIMEEADRVMKQLAGGKDQLTGTVYDSRNTALPPGFQNLLERYVAARQSGSFSNRFWFTPNLENLKRYIDPVTGAATVVFDQSSVKLNTEALLLGQPEDPTARGFADWFNANYDALAGIAFPVHDPNDPTGTKVIFVKIFDELRDAMKAVALARFFHDNNIPLDTWWLNSWTPPAATIPATIPTLTNSLANGAVTVNFYGGVSIKKPNTYLPDVVAQSVSNAVMAQRPAGPGDSAGQAWNVTGAPTGPLTAVAAALDAQKQDGNVTLGAADLSFASPGGQLAFERYYNSAYLGSTNLGLGWQPTRFALQFQRPSWVDDYGLMRDGNGNKLPVTGPLADTLLRSGEVRLVDAATGQLLNFLSSLTSAYSLDNEGSPILATAGLTAKGVPTFAPGQYQDGSTLTQDPTTHNYTLTRLDGSTVVFDPQGNLVKTTDTRGHAINYAYSSSKLAQISDAAGQVLAVTYGSDGRIQYVAGPDKSATPQRRIAFLYDTSARLIEVDTQALQSGGTYNTVRSLKYQYNSNNQLSAVIGPDGLTTLTTVPDLRGRSTQKKDALGNTVAYSFALNAATGLRTTQATDLGTTAGNDPVAQGVDALKYFAAGATSKTQFDVMARPTQAVDALGNPWTYGYTSNSLQPNTVTLPTPHRPALSIQYNAANLPTLVSDPANTGGTPVQIVYNSANLPVQITDAKGLVVQYTYTAWNDVATVTVAYGTPQAATTTFNYNPQKRLQSIVDPLGHTVASYTYNAVGQVLTVTDGDKITTSYTYDTLGRRQRVYDPRLTGTVKYDEVSYNENDQVTQMATPTGALTFVYDAATHRLVSATDLTGATTQNGYDAATGLLTSVTQVSSSGNAVTQQVYDRRGQLALLIAPDGNRTAFRSDVLGRPTNLIEEDGTNPTAQLNAQITSPSTTTVTVQASQPILVAALKYWVDGQPSSTAVSQSVRLNDQSTFAFQLTGLNTSQVYRYELTLTDRVGRMTTLPQGLLGSIPPATAKAVVANPHQTTSRPLTVVASPAPSATKLIGGHTGSALIVAGESEHPEVGGNTRLDLPVAALDAVMAEWGRSLAPSATEENNPLRSRAGATAGAFNSGNDHHKAPVPVDSAGDVLTGGEDIDEF